MIIMDLNDLNMFDVAGNIDVSSVFVNSWFFGLIDFGFVFILFATAFILNRYGFSFGNIISIMFVLSLAFATLSGSLVMWGIVVVVLVLSGLRFFQTILFKI
jgi:hypothetical protein